GHVVAARPAATGDFDRAAERFVDEEIGYGDVLRLAAAEPEDRPPRAEGAAGDRHELAAAEQRAGVVRTDHGAVAQVDVLAGDEMEPVVVAVDAIVNMNPVHPHVLALN